MTISSAIIVNFQDKSIPRDVVEEVRNLWADLELSNDFCYASFDPSHYEENYPKISAYLKDNLTENQYNGRVLLHFWW